MVNEATIIVEPQHPYNMTVADGTGIEQGTILKMTDPLTASISDGANDIVAGIAGAEKIASDGVTKLKVYRDGWWKVTLSGTCTIGDALATHGNPNIVTAPAVLSTLSGTTIIGTALETGTDGQTILMELRPQATGGSQ